MQNFDIIINLHGKHRGFVRLKYYNSNIIFSSKGIPDNCEIYFAYENKALNYNQFMEQSQIILKNFSGVLVMQNGRVIMEGTVYRNNCNLGVIRRMLEYEQQSTFRNINRQEANSPNTPKSKALQEILNNAKELFGETEQNIQKTEDFGGIGQTVQKTEKREPAHRNTFNPFSNSYPHSRWKLMRWRNVQYLESIVDLEGESLHITAIPSSNVSIDYMHRQGFTKLTQADDGTMYFMKIRHLPKP